MAPRAVRRSEPPAASVKTSEPAEPKTSPRLAQGITSSLSDGDGAPAASGLESLSEESQGAGAPETQRRGPDGRDASGELDCRGEGGQGRGREEEEESSDHSLR